MIRRATRADLPRILAIRDSVGAARLSDPAVVTEAAAAGLIDGGALWVWQEADLPVAGFAAGDGRDGSIWALLVAPGQEGRGIGRALLTAACATLRAAGHGVATLAVEPDSPAERHYRAAGWSAAGPRRAGPLVLQKPL